MSGNDFWINDQTTIISFDGSGHLCPLTLTDNWTPTFTEALDLIPDSPLNDDSIERVMLMNYIQNAWLRCIAPHFAESSDTSGPMTDGGRITEPVSGVA